MSILESAFKYIPLKCVLNVNVVGVMELCMYACDGIMISKSIVFFKDESLEHASATWPRNYLPQGLAPRFPYGWFKSSGSFEILRYD